MATITLNLEVEEIDIIFRTFSSVDPTSMFDVIQLLKQKILVQMAQQQVNLAEAAKAEEQEAPDGGQAD